MYTYVSICECFCVRVFLCRNVRAPVRKFIYIYVCVCVSVMDAARVCSIMLVDH